MHNVNACISNIVHMSPNPSKVFRAKHIKLGDVFEIRRIMCEFYPRLPRMYALQGHIHDFLEVCQF